MEQEIQELKNRVHRLEVAIRKLADFVESGEWNGIGFEVEKALQAPEEPAPNK